jgi:subtilisin-like proprotein convertase family protein
MKYFNKISLLIIIFFLNYYAFCQKKWEIVNSNSILSNKNIQRESFPKTFDVYQTSFNELKDILKTAPSVLKSNNSNTIISIPNTKGIVEQFRIFEFSNFEPNLQEQFPDIRSYVGKGISDPNATIRLSIDLRGMQAMIFRTNKRNEFIEPYTDNPNIYAIYESKRNKGQLAFTCSTDDVSITSEISNSTNLTARSSSGELLVFRLALSSTSEYAAYFGATNASQFSLVLAAYNATMTRVNGVFEKDFAIHMNIIASSQNVAYYNAATDPYSNASSGAGGAWNTELQNNLTSVIGNANYDIGHLFGASGGGGNAGCIGCVCEDDTSSLTDKNKGSGFTSPADGIPMGDNFDIDYVAHEMGHQFGGNHTFSMNVEGTGVNMEPGSGSTIMGYAGITAQDVQPHSDDYFVYATIKQVQDNMLSKTCPTQVTISNIKPNVSAGLDYTIPKSTPFILTGTGSDPNGDTLSYCWEQNDSATNQTGNNSAAIVSKTGGPNWRSYNPVSVPYRYFPRIESIIANQATTAGTEINVEALSSVARTLNFVLTARDSYPGAGQTNSDAMKITVSNSAGPFIITAPNTAVSWTVGTNQSVTWNVAGTTANGVNCSYVDIYLSTDGGYTYPVLLASQVPNDGSETITVPNNIGTTNRIMVKGNNHVFFDISNVNFSIVAPTSSFALSFDGTIGGQHKSICQGNDLTYSLNYTALSGFSGTTTFAISGNPSGTTAAFSPTSISSTGTVDLTISNTSAITPNIYTLTVTGTSGTTTRILNLYLEVLNGSFATLSLTSPNNLEEIQSDPVNLVWSNDPVATLYTLEVATDADFNSIILSTDVATNSYSLTGLLNFTNYYWRVLPKNTSCSGTFSTTNRFTTNFSCFTYNSTDIPITIPATGTPTVTSTLTIPSGNNVTIADINVTVNILHSYVSDLTVSLVSPNNTTINLLVNQCTNNSNIDATFDDSGTTLSCATNPAVSGTIKPTQLLSLLNGTDSQGVWTLKVVDAYNQDGGAIISWSLNICNTPSPLSCGQITTTWNGSSWSNNKPTENVAATINGNLTTSENITACSLDIIGTSQVIIASGTNAFITNAVNVSPTASLTIQNNANLIQTADVANSANAMVYRNSNALMRLDYTIWSSPVTGAQTLKQFSPNTLNNRFYNYNTTSNIYYSVSDPITQTFDLGTGYLIRMPDNHPTTPTLWNGQFNGNLNNGTIAVSLSYDGTGQSFNMIGNPYPSTINAEDFITDNISDITGTLYFWRKTNNAAGTAYATYTLGGATTTSPTSPTPNGIIQVGQGFFVEAKNTATPTATFLNNHRVENNQNQFFKNAATIEKHRIWLNVTNTSGLFSQSMIGYMTNATNAYDEAIDGKYINDSQISFNSLLNNEEYAVQLVAPTFNITDVFPMKFKTTTAGDFTISIDHVDGIFVANQDVYLRDNLLQIIHNLSVAEYNFTTQIGEFNTRFDIIFEPNALSNLENQIDDNTIIAYANDNQLHVESSNLNMQKIIIYDALGRILYSNDSVLNKGIIISSLKMQKQALFITIELENGTKAYKKIIY